MEIALDGVQTSPRYPGGVALQHAREADTLGAVLAVRAGASVSGPAHPPR